MTPVSLPDQVRAACAWVAERARSVRIDEQAIGEYAARLPQPGLEDDPAPFADDPETAAAFALLAAASPLTPAEIDSALWNRGRGRRYKSLPRPRSRNRAY